MSKLKTQIRPSNSRRSKRATIAGGRQYAMQPAARIINDIFDGPPALAEKLKVHKTTIYRCLKPRSAGGTDGEVPASLQKKMVLLARKLGRTLSYSDFHSE
jgi:hypothetical protein